jgi:hypothetical protein
MEDSPRNRCFGRNRSDCGVGSGASLLKERSGTLNVLHVENFSVAHKKPQQITQALVLPYHFSVTTSSFSILSNPAPLDHERFSAHRELESLLKKSLCGPDSSSHDASALFRFDLGSRALYAADSSNYRQLPIGVVFPRDAADVEAALAACRATGAAVLPRGAGTSLAGQCVNVAVVFDYSRYMNALDAIDPQAKTAPPSSITSPTRPTPPRIRAAPSAASSAITVAASTACSAAKLSTTCNRSTSFSTTAPG